MKLKKSILFWAVIALLAGLGAVIVLELFGLAPRAWLRESFCVLDVLGIAAGIFQLLLRIPVRWLKTALITLCAAGALLGGYYGFLLLRFMHCPERHGEFEGTPCIVEMQKALWGSTYSEWYYEDCGLFFHGAKILSVEHSVTY